MSRNNNNSLSNGAQIGYIVEWFREWSELQREDFLPILAEKISSNGVYVNGIYNSMKSVNLDKPMSLFQCRIKLFNEWFPGWTEDDREKLLKQFNEVDDTFTEKLQEELTGDKKDNEDFMIVPAQDEPIVIVSIATPPEIEEENDSEGIIDPAPTDNSEFHSEIVEVN